MPCRPTHIVGAIRAESAGVLVVAALVFAGVPAAFATPAAELPSIVHTRVDCAQRPRGLVNGINIDKTCRRAYFVRRGRVLRVVAASTGKAGYETRSGHFRIYRRLNRWAESKLYPGAMMYRPMFFSGGQAIHGSVTDWLVRPYPASHGCVRMHKHDIDWLWRQGWGVGTPVHVFRR